VDDIRRKFPPIDSLPFYAALFADQFSIEATMRAQLQDLSRSIGCRGLREIQIHKLDLAKESMTITDSDWRLLRDTIEDELPGPGRASHFDVRLQLFEGLQFSREALETVIPLPQSVEGTRIFRKLFEDRSLLEITAAVGAIEQWYVPLAAQLEAHYLRMGYTQRQVATFALHKEADVQHSETALYFAAKYSQRADHAAILEAVDAAFCSVRLYDAARFAAATDNHRGLKDFLSHA